MAIFGKSGVTKKTPENIVFGAGTIHKGLKYTPATEGKSAGWNFADSLVGATNGGSKFTITPEVTNIEVDGIGVKSKGLAQKTSETATMEINLAELTKDIIQAATLGQEGNSADANYDVIESKTDIEDGDYWENIAFVGKTLKGKYIIAILENALCTSGFEHEGKNKDGAAGKYAFESYAEFGDSTDKDTLPWHIYYPKASTTTGESNTPKES